MRLQIARCALLNLLGNRARLGISKKGGLRGTATPSGTVKGCRRITCPYSRNPILSRPFDVHCLSGLEVSGRGSCCGAGKELVVDLRRVFCEKSVGRLGAGATDSAGFLRGCRVRSQ